MSIPAEPEHGLLRLSRQRVFFTLGILPQALVAILDHVVSFLQYYQVLSHSESSGLGAGYRPPYRVHGTDYRSRLDKRRAEAVVGAGVRAGAGQAQRTHPGIRAEVPVPAPEREALSVVPRVQIVSTVIRINGHQ